MSDLLMDEKYDPLSLMTMSLIYADYAKEIDRLWHSYGHEFQFGISREQFVNEIKRMEAFILEHRPRK